MPIYTWRPGESRNFGDELNAIVWPRLVDDFETRLGDDVFFGIGTLLSAEVQEQVDAPRRVVFGTGAGYGRRPRLDSSCSIYCVRGPLTADALGLPRGLAIADGAILLRRLTEELGLAGRAKQHSVAFLPHHVSAAASNGAWARACARSDVAYLDPRAEPSELLADIAAAEYLVCEAMHGAVVADALRVPWIPVICGWQVNAFKWLDWCRSVGVPYAPSHVPVVFAGDPSPYSIERAASCLRTASSLEPSLSADHVIESLTQQLEERLERLERDYPRRS